MSLVQDDHVIRAFAADTSNQTFDVWDLPRASGGDHDFFHPHVPHPLPKRAAVNSAGIGRKRSLHIPAKAIGIFPVIPDEKGKFMVDNKAGGRAGVVTVQTPCPLPSRPLGRVACCRSPLAEEPLCFGAVRLR
jgi:hypothetical protein